MASRNDLRIGTSGWSYPTGEGTWNGIFYPPHSKSTRGKGKFDELAYYADRFDTVEINSTFYRTPAVNVTKSWAARTPKDFEFSLKLYQKFTHPKMFKEAALKRAPGAEGRQHVGKPAGRSHLTGDFPVSREGAELEALATINQSDVDEFKRAMDPLADAGKLGALLAQFPPSFKADTHAIDYLAWLLHEFRDHRVAVELRHRTWSDDLDTTLKLLNGTKAAFVQIDEPKFRTSIDQTFLPNVKGFYYMRLHGRNAKEWWKHAKSEDRYNYLYSAGELDEFAGVADAVRTLVKKMYLYTNNHFAGKAVANAVMLKERLGLPVEGDYPDEFLERYPETRGIVKPASEAAAAEKADTAESEPEAKPAPARKSRRSPRSPSLF
jgi:uncharacterized protein YecE (DUF72 family)